MAAAPTGDILKFIEAFNKDFDAYLVKGQETIDKGKATLEELKKMSEPKEGPFPRGNTDVKTIGDLIAYTYDIDKGIDKTPVLKPTNLYPPIVDDDNMADVKGFEKDVGKAGKDKIRQIENAIRQSGRRFEFRGQKYPRNSSTPFLNALKEKKGPNPDLWSPGQYAFDVFMLEMGAAVKKPENYDGIFDIEYQKELDAKTKSFTYSVASFSPDGKVDESSNDIGYAAFYEIMLKIEKDLEYYGIGQLLDIQEVFGAPTGTALAGGGNPPRNPASFPSLRTKYLDGKLEELKQNKSQNKLELSRGETINEMFFGNYEFLGLYLAFKQAGDAYEPVTLPLDEAKYPGSSVFQEVEEPEKKPEEPVAPTTSGVDPTTSGVVEEKTGQKEAEIKGYVGKIKPFVKGLENGFAIEAKKDLPDFSVYVGDPEEWKKKGIVTDENEEPAQDDYENLDGAEIVDDEYVENAYSGSEEELLELKIEAGQEDNTGDLAKPTNESAPDGLKPEDIKPVSSLDNLLEKAGKCARTLGLNGRVNTANMKKGYIEGVHGLCPQGTQAVCYAMIGEWKKSQGNGDSYSFKGSAVLDPRFYNDKIRPPGYDGVSKPTYWKDKSLWQIGDVIAVGYKNGKPFGHIQVWTGINWMSDFKQNTLQASADWSTPALWRLNQRGIEAVKKNMPTIA